MRRVAIGQPCQSPSEAFAPDRRCTHVCSSVVTLLCCDVSAIQLKMRPEKDADISGGAVAEQTRHFETRMVRLTPPSQPIRTHR
jgi:hypothetical protein